MQRHRARIAAALIFALTAWGSAARAMPAGETRAYHLDSPASSVRARVAFFGFSSKTATFPSVSGRLTLPQRAEGTGSRPITLEVVIDARAIDAPDPVTLRRLKGPGFFDVDHYPTVRFTGKSLRMTGARTAEVDGVLSARDVTHDETLAVTFGEPPTAGQGRRAVTLDGTMRIDRRVYGMTAWPLIVGRRVDIAIHARMVPDPPA